MRNLPLKKQFAASGASFSERYGTEIVSQCSGYEQEYHYVRDAAGMTDFSFMQKFTVPEESGIDFLDSLFAGNVAKTRFGRVLHTFLPDGNGNLVADCYIANNDEEYVVLCESIADDRVTRDIFTKNNTAGVTDLSETHVVIGLDGYKAWAVVKELFGADVLGLPYLSIERYDFEGTGIRLFRAGKTSEFGYLIMAPVEIGAALFNKLLELVKKQNGGLCGSLTHDSLRLEGRFFNIFSEGARVKDPLPLGLQWMIDFDKDAFTGRDALMERRTAGLKTKIVGVNAGKGDDALKAGSPVFDGAERIGEIVTTCFSYILDATLGLALLRSDVAFAGLEFRGGEPGGRIINTISMPPIMPKSLTVKLDEM